MIPENHNDDSLSTYAEENEVSMKVGWIGMLLLVAVAAVIWRVLASQKIEAPLTKKQYRER